MPQALATPLLGPEEAVGEQGRHQNGCCAAEMQRPRVPLAVTAGLVVIVLVSSFTTRGQPGQLSLPSKRCGLAITDEMAKVITDDGLVNQFKGEIGWWYNWQDHTITDPMLEGDAEFIPMWWGRANFTDHQGGNSWCSDKGYSDIPQRSKSWWESSLEFVSTSLVKKGVAFTWNECDAGTNCSSSAYNCTQPVSGSCRNASATANGMGGCTDGATAANRVVVSPSITAYDSNWIQAFMDIYQAINPDVPKVCSWHMHVTYSCQWGDCSCMRDKLSDTEVDPALELRDAMKWVNTSCEIVFINELGTGGCNDQNLAAQTLQKLRPALQDFPNVYVSWWSGERPEPQSNEGTYWLWSPDGSLNNVGSAYLDLCLSL